MLKDATCSADADTLGIEALGFIASDEDLTRRFLDITGLEVGQLRSEATKPGFFVAVLDFILANEKDVVDLASQLVMQPATIGRARNVLAQAVGIPQEDYPA